MFLLRINLNLFEPVVNLIEFSGMNDDYTLLR